MEVSQRPDKADDSADHRWARILGTSVALATLTLPIIMIAYYSTFRSNAQPVPEKIYQLQEIQS